ncbi:DUF3653 domain-containing protein [Enterovibrio norvegicus]|uniref:DUF3653 domain-containing protein n=1 Tax=Enterovibrio norvegicus TaxID=188144 RepID=UPI0030D2395C
MNWQGFRVSEHRAVVITPDGQEFNLRELDGFPLWRDQYYALRERYGVIEIVQPQKPLDSMSSYRGGKRQQPAPWIPIRDKLK